MRILAMTRCIRSTAFAAAVGVFVGPKFVVCFFVGAVLTGALFGFGIEPGGNMQRSLVSFRWGKKRRAPSALVRVSVSTRSLLDGVPDKYRRDFIDRAVRAFINSDWYREKLSGGVE